MTQFSASITTAANNVLGSHIDVRTETARVPDVADIALEKNQGVLIEGCYLYADLADSSTLGQRVKKPVAAKIIRSYINGAAGILRRFGGEIRSFDGDRVMAIFIGRGKETKAVQASYGVNWLVDQYLRQRINEYWPDLQANRLFTLNHRIGIATGEALLTRTGVRGDNDLISVGSAPNVAAKLSDLKTNYSICVTKEVHESMDDGLRRLSNGTNPWRTVNPSPRIGGTTFVVLGANVIAEPS